MGKISQTVINLRAFLEEIPVEGVQAILSTFSCPLNADIEGFLRNNAIDFSNQGKAQTHLVIGEVSGHPEIFGYFTLTNKILAVAAGSISKSAAKKLDRFGILDEITNTYNIPAPLIAQLGKNYARNIDAHFEGGILLQIACSKIAAIQRELSGKLTYIECDDEPKLIRFYEQNGFRVTDSGKDSTAHKLVQMIKYV